MPFRTAAAFVFLCAFLSPFLRAGDVIEHAGTHYWVYSISGNDRNKLRLFLAESKGKPNTFTDLEARLNRQDERLEFAVNAGIFEPSFMPTGLHVSDGRTVVDLNLQEFKKSRKGEFTPNFYLKPNGVFYVLDDGTPGVLESSQLRTVRFRSKIRIASQSGPLLVQEGRIHPILTKDSTSTRHRNGVGVTKDGSIVFACTVSDPERGLSNLYHFASLFTEKLLCPNALYLDGDISYIFIRGKTKPLRKTNWFGGIFAVTEKQKP